MTKKVNAKQKKKKYIIKSSEREVYQQENYNELIVEDSSGILEQEGVLKKMFESLCNYNLRNYISLHFDSTIYETKVKLKTKGNDTYAKVIIRQKPWFTRMFQIFK